MSTLLALAALIFVAAITPGPNNFAVLNAAARHGMVGARSAITGVLLGSLALLLLALSGVGALFTAHPRVRDAVSFAGSAYLGWLGVRMIAGARARRSRSTVPMAPPGVGHLMGLQFTNPKSWTMILTAVAAARSAMSPPAAAMALVVLFLAIPTACLLAWAWLGARVLPRLQQRTARAWCDSVLGALLVISAVALVVDVTRGNTP